MLSIGARVPTGTSIISPVSGSLMKGRSAATKEVAATISSATEDVNGAIIVKKIAKGVVKQFIHGIEGEKLGLITYTPSSKLLSFPRRYRTDNTILHEAIP